MSVRPIPASHPAAVMPSHTVQRTAHLDEAPPLRLFGASWAVAHAGPGPERRITKLLIDEQPLHI